MKSPTQLLQALLNDISRLDPDVKGTNRDIRTIRRRYKNEGYGFLTKALPALGAAFDQGLSSGKFACPSHFKKVPRGSIPRLFSGLISKVFYTDTGLLKDDIDSGHVISVRQLCYLLKKVSLEAEDSDKLHSAAISAFFLNDDLIGRDILHGRSLSLFKGVSRLVLNDLEDRTIRLSTDSSQESVYKHGPGAVMEGYRPNQKWKGVYEGIITDAFDTDILQYDLFGLSTALSLSDNVRFQKGYSEYVPNLPSVQVPSRGMARLVTVPKDSSSRRTITVEPLLNQFVQQGLNCILRDSIEKCQILSNVLALSDQSKNQKLALEGSKLANWSTLDLKSASDLLSLELVGHTFHNHPEFFRMCWKSRSGYVQLDGNPRKIAKYAGMGNATTFPVQSVVFALLAITAIVDVWEKYPNYRTVKRASRHVRVFGDDIIVKTEYAQRVVDWLHSAGLIVNTKKSFLNGYFKESCGVDAFRGVDCTPLYVRNRPDESSTEASAIAGLVAFSNNAWMRGYYKTATLIQNEVESRLGYKLPLVSKDSGALGWISRQDAMDANFWNPWLQRLELKARVVRSVNRKDILDGLPALLKFFHVPLLGRPLKHLLETPVRFQLRIARKRVPTRVG